MKRALDDAPIAIAATAPTEALAHNNSVSRAAPMQPGMLKEPRGNDEVQTNEVSTDSCVSALSHLTEGTNNNEVVLKTISLCLISFLIVTNLLKLQVAKGLLLPNLLGFTIAPSTSDRN